MFRKILCGIAAILILTACSSGDSTASGESGSGDTADTGLNYGKVMPEDAYQNYEKVAGKSYKHLNMPEVIVPEKFERAYKVDFNLLPPDCDKDKVVKLFKDFLGDNCLEPETVGTGGIIVRKIDPKAADENSVYVGDGSFSDDGYFSLYLKSRQMQAPEDYDESQTKHYRVSTDGGTVIEFAGSDTTVAQEAGLIEKQLSDLMGDTFGPYTYGIDEMHITGFGEIGANGSVRIEGIPLQYIASRYEKKLDAYTLETDYVAFNYANVNDKNEISNIAGELPNFLGKTELDGLIPIERAAMLADNAIKDETVYEIADVRLMYCALIKYPLRNSEGYYSPEHDTRASIRTLEPTWCFFIKKDDPLAHEDFIKVNAVTGEVRVLLGEDEK